MKNATPCAGERRKVIWPSSELPMQDTSYDRKYNYSGGTERRCFSVDRANIVNGKSRDEQEPTVLCIKLLVYVYGVYILC